MHRAHAIRFWASAVATLVALLSSCAGETARPAGEARTATASEQSGVGGAGGTPPSTTASRAGAASARPTDEGPPRFLARQEVEVPGRAIGATAADVDGDGRADLVVALEEPGAILVFASSAGGLASAPRSVAVGGYPLPAVVAHGSAGRELVVVSRATRELVRIGPDGSPVARRALDLSPRALATGALRGTRAVFEVVVAGEGPGDAGRPTTVRGWSAGGEGFEVLAQGVRATCLHVAGDGRTLWLGTQLPPRVEAFRLDADPGDGRPTPVADVSLGGIPRAFAEADVDGDGDPELVCAGGDRDLWVFGLGVVGDSTTWGAVPPVRLPAPGLVPVALEAADLDGNGRDELVTLQFYDSGYGAVGAFAPESERFTFALSEYAGQAPVDVAVADFDGDGVPDLAIANSDARRVSLLPGTGLAQERKDAFYQARRTAVGDNPLALAAGDLDGDGAPEVLVASGTGGRLAVLANEYSLLGGRRDVAVGASPTAVLTTDVDGDGHLDAVTLVRPPEGARLSILYGDGAGGLDARGREPVPLGGDAADLCAVDLAGDGGAELVAADPLGARLVVVDVPRPLPAGWEPVAVPLSLGAPPAAACAVPTGDAREALAVAFAGDAPSLALYVRPGASLERVASAPATGAPVDLAAGDFDGDGRVDVAWLARRAPGENQGFVRLFLARGDSLAPGPEYPTGLAPAQVACGDLDGDGRADVVVAAQNSHNANVWLARGEGLLERWPDLGAGLGCHGVVLTDLNLDGRLDVVVANAFSHDVSAIYNVPR